MRSGSAATQSPKRQQPPNDRAPRWSVRTVKASPGVAPGAGRGLFAVVEIKAGEVIDRACTAEIDAVQCLALDKMHPVGDFYFEHPKDKARGLMAFGLPSLCNHRDVPNANVRFVYEDGLGWVAQLHALTDIAEGTEITYRYKCPVWFERDENEG